MKSRGRQKFQFHNSIVNWEEFGSATWVYIQKIQIFYLFHELGKIEKSRRESKNPKAFLRIGKNLEVQTKINIQKISILNL